MSDLDKMQENLPEEENSAPAHTPESPAPEGGEETAAAEAVEISQEELEQIIASVQNLMTEKEETEQKLLRMTADFDNFRRRTRQEREDTIKNANQQLLCGLLPVLDNFERAVAMDDCSPYGEGINLIYRQFIHVLQEEGLERMNVQDQDFDPQFHEAIAQEEVAEEQKGKVLAEIQSGYLFKGRLLRAARVQVGV